MNISQQYTPYGSWRDYGPNKPKRGIFLHHTAGSQSAPPPAPSPNGSWNRLFLPNGDRLDSVPTATGAAFCVLKTDIFRPNWLLTAPDWAVSDANYSSINYEIQYAPQAPYGETPTSQQLASIRQTLREDYACYGPLPVLGHGQVQSDKWPTEPHGFDYDAVNLGEFQPGQGRFLLPTPPESAAYGMNPTPDAQIKGWLESFGQPINPDTAIMKFVYQAFRLGDPPTGNWRGPALPPGEYNATTLDGRSVVRHRFSAGTVEYDPSTGGLGWCELNLHPEIVTEV